MLERLYFRHSVYLLVEWDEGYKAAHVRAVIYGRLEDALHATHLAACMSVPVQCDSRGLSRPTAASAASPEPASPGASQSSGASLTV
jgi:hypothetical protein